MNPLQWHVIVVNWIMSSIRIDLYLLHYDFSEPLFCCGLVVAHGNLVEVRRGFVWLIIAAVDPMLDMMSPDQVGLLKASSNEEEIDIQQYSLSTSCSRLSLPYDHVDWCWVQSPVWYFPGPVQWHYTMCKELLSIKRSFQCSRLFSHSKITLHDSRNARNNVGKRPILDSSEAAQPKNPNLHPAQCGKYREG